MFNTKEPVQNSIKTEKADIQIDIMNWLSTLLSYWWLLLICLLMAFGTAKIYLRYTKPLYSSSAKVMIKGAGGGNLSEANILMADLGIDGGGSDMSDEIEILQSTPILSKAARKIKAHVSYFADGSEKDLYLQSPIVFDSLILKDEDQEYSFYVDLISDNSFMLSVSQGTKGKKHTLGSLVQHEYGMFRLIKNDLAPFKKGKYMIKVRSLDAMALSYKSKLFVEMVGEKSSSSILSVTIISDSRQKSRDLINAIIEVYNEDNVDDDNQVLRNSIVFIDKRLESLSDELAVVEKDIEEFKSRNNIITENATSSLGYALQDMRASISDLSSFELEKDVLNYLEKEIAEMKDSHQLIPPNIGASNSALSNLISEYNELFLQQKKLRATITDESPVIYYNEQRLDDLKSLIAKTIKNLQRDLKIPMKNARNEINRLRGTVRYIPQVEQQLLEKMRLQGIKEQLYLYLLKRRQETELSMAVTTPATRLIEPPRTNWAPVFPRRRLVTIGFLLLGLFIPIATVSLIALFKNTIDTQDTLKSLTTIPVLGQIRRNKSKEKIIIKHGHRSAIAEMFRSLRTNLNFMNVGNEKPVVTMTSTFSGEGKSITAMNLALTISLSGKKTVLVDMDLRKPRVAEYLGKQNVNGVTNYLTGQAALADIVNDYEDSDSFKYISSGPIPPNPAELIMSDKMKELINELKASFDYVILDTPPIGVVSDALLFRDYITNTLLVVRQNYTKKSMVKFLDELYSKGELVKPAIIFNDVKNDKFSGGYGNYGGAGYYTEES